MLLADPLVEIIFFLIILKHSHCTQYIRSYSPKRVSMLLHTTRLCPWLNPQPSRALADKQVIRREQMGSTEGVC